MNDWKNEHANRSWEAVEHPAVGDVMREYADNMGFTLEGLPRFGLQKVAHYAAQVARAQALGFDPDLLRMTPDEANSALLEKAAEMVLAGVPTHLIDVCSDCAGAGRVRFVNGGPHGNEAGWMKCPTCKR